MRTGLASYNFSWTDQYVITSVLNYLSALFGIFNFEKKDTIHSIRGNMVSGTAQNERKKLQNVPKVTRSKKKRQLPLGNQRATDKINRLSRAASRANIRQIVFESSSDYMDYSIFLSSSSLLLKGWMIGHWRHRTVSCLKNPRGCPGDMQNESKMAWNWKAVHEERQ